MKNSEFEYIIALIVKQLEGLLSIEDDEALRLQLKFFVENMKKEIGKE